MRCLGNWPNIGACDRKKQRKVAGEQKWRQSSRTGLEGGPNASGSYKAVRGKGHVEFHLCLSSLNSFNRDTLSCVCSSGQMICSPTDVVDHVAYLVSGHPPVEDNTSSCPNRGSLMFRLFLLENINICVRVKSPPTIKCNVCLLGFWLRSLTNASVSHSAPQPDFDLTHLITLYLSYERLVQVVSSTKSSI